MAHQGGLSSSARTPVRSAELLSAAMALLIIGLIYTVLPQRLRIGPWWLVLVLILILLVPLLVSRYRGYHDAAFWLSRAATALVTLVVLLSAVLLLTRLPGGKTPGSDLLRDAALIWSGNVIVFALWYWEIDGGGPTRRHPDHYASDDFIFPQLQQVPVVGGGKWVPRFLDYLFLAFNTSTAFSPTDTLVLSQRAKALLMCQSLLSLVVIGVLAARAINTL